MNIFSQLISAQLELLSADPTTGVTPGRLYFNTTTKCPRIYDGTQWVQWIESGKIEEFGNSTTPSGYLPCDGASYSTALYPTLFSAIGYAFGGAAGSFNVPDKRGRVSVGAGSGVGLTTRNLGDQGGEETHVLSPSEMPSHNHGINDPGHTHIEQFSANSSGASELIPLFTTGDAGPISQFTTLPTASSTTGITTQAAGGGGSHNNMQPFLATNFFIKI